MSTSSKTLRAAAVVVVVVGSALAATGAEASAKATTPARCDPGAGTILAANGFIAVYSDAYKHQQRYFACRPGKHRGAAFANEVLLIGELTDVRVAGYYMAYSVAGCPKNDDYHCGGETVVRNVRTGRRVTLSRYGNAPSQDDALVLTTRGAAAWVRSSLGSDGRPTRSVTRSSSSGQVSTLDAGPAIAPELGLSTLGGDLAGTPTSRVPTLFWKNGDVLHSTPLD